MIEHTSLTLKPQIFDVDQVATHFSNTVNVFECCSFVACKVCTFIDTQQPFEVESLCVVSLTIVSTGDSVSESESNINADLLCVNFLRHNTHKTALNALSSMQQLRYLSPSLCIYLALLRLIDKIHSHFTLWSFDFCRCKGIGQPADTEQQTKHAKTH